MRLIFNRYIYIIHCNHHLTNSYFKNNKHIKADLNKYKINIKHFDKNTMYKNRIII